MIVQRGVSIIVYNTTIICYLLLKHTERILFPLLIADEYEIKLYGLGKIEISAI